ncbi:MAG: NAD(P)H-binding protein [Kofleriaceae bacterium]
MTTWVLVGCGYTGERLARTLVARGDDVVAARRNPNAVERLVADVGVRAVRSDLALPDTLVDLVPPGAIVVVLAPPGPDPAGEIRALLDAARSAKRIVYVSSTGVYGRGHGQWVDESAPLSPLSPSGEARVAAEAALATSSISHVALRVAGIYGPDRGIADRIRLGQYRVIGDGTSHISRIHVDDLVAVIIAAGESDATGAINVADDEPSPIGEVANAVAAAIGVAPPVRTPVEQVPPEVAAMLTADRKIANARMKALGVVLRHPSWRTSLVAARD